MNSQTAQNNSCPRPEIAAFLDGELITADELEFERHTENCNVCAVELKRQEKLLLILNSALKTERDIKLPENFTEIIVTNAETKVSGLRRPRERFNALLICFGLILLAITGFGGKMSGLFDAPGNFLEQAAAVGNLILRFVYDIALGVTIVLRSLCSQFVFKNEAANSLLLIGLFVSSLIFCSIIVPLQTIRELGKVFISERFGYSPISRLSAIFLAVTYLRSVFYLSFSTFASRSKSI